MRTLFKKFLWLVLPKPIFYPLLNWFKDKRAFVRRKTRYISSAVRAKFSPTPKKKLSRIMFGVHIAEHCNLNCAHCAHFSPLADKILMPVEDFRRDVERMAELFNHECERFQIYGGEPLLHPEIITLIEIARKNFTSGNIYILSNGILLSQQPPEFWKACHDNNIGIHVSHYNIDINLPQIVELAKQYDVQFTCQSYFALAKFQTMHIDLSGKSNGRKNFYSCGDANNCIILGYGKLYTCPFAYTIRHFNKKFGQNIPVTPDDYIDIYEENDPNKILLRLTQQIPLCSYCNFSNLGSAAWRRSNLEMSEWV